MAAPGPAAVRPAATAETRPRRATAEGGRAWRRSSGYTSAPAKESTIRTLFALLTGLVIALGLGLAAYSYLLAVQRGPLLATDAPAPAPDAAPLALPERLPPRRDLNEPVAASTNRPLVAEDALTVIVTGVPASLRDRIGVATFASVTGADFVWTPLRDGTVAADGSITVRSVVPAREDLDITLASAAEHARHAYFTHEHLPAAARRGDGTTTVRLEATLETVTFELNESPVGQACRGPWRLVRLDDARWLPQQLASTGLYLSGETPTSLVLGSGTYQLQDPLLPARQQEFTVPGTNRVVLSAELALPRAGRR